MKVNVGGIDKVLRILVGLGLIAWTFLGGPVWAGIGLVPLATGLVGFLPRLHDSRLDRVETAAWTMEARSALPSDLCLRSTLFRGDHCGCGHCTVLSFHR